MPRQRNKLSVMHIKNATKSGRYSDGGGLYLSVSKASTKSWVFIWVKNKRKREMGLGSENDLTLKKARLKAAKCREMVLEGKDPIVARKRENEPTFLECAEKFLEDKESGWKNASHRANWRMSLRKHAMPIHHHKVSQIDTPDVLRVLKPLWQTKQETASRLRGRVEAVLDYAKAMGWRTGENPAVWRGNLKSLLPAKTHKIRHHPALPIDDIPTFMANLRNREATTARLLELIILSASRSGEARGATWDEIDLENAVWTIPGSRMKAGKEHSIPLCDRAIEIIKAQNEYQREGLVFCQIPSGKPFSVNATRALLKRMVMGQYTTHGFRSTFRDWAGDRTNVQRETIEAALAHRLKDKAEAAYRRSTAMEKRRDLMDRWSEFCSGKSNIVEIDYVRKR